jgi:hypothetical protein
VSIVTVLTLIQIACYQLCAVPGILRIVRRKSSADLSVWREALIISGACFQLVATYLAGAPWQLFMSPITSICSVGTMLGVIVYYRRPR